MNWNLMCLDECFYPWYVHLFYISGNLTDLEGEYSEHGILGSQTSYRIQDITMHCNENGESDEVPDNSDS